MPVFTSSASLVDLHEYVIYSTMRWLDFISKSFGFLFQEKRNIAFMQELRCLFALMVGSTRRFVDPSAAVELLRDAFRTSEAQQVHE